MNTSPTALLRHLRDLQPDRNLEDHEARGIAERQALRLLQILGQHEPAVNVAAIADLPPRRVPGTLTNRTIDPDLRRRD